MTATHLAFATLSLVIPGCGSTTSPSVSNNLTVMTTSPVAGSTVVIPPQYVYNFPGGVVVPRGSGLLSVRVSMTAASQVPWAQLNVYLLTGGTRDQYCGQNLPDSPTWQFLTPGWKTDVTVSGFQIYRLPCDVTGFRAMLHMRNNGLLVPPSASETISENSLATTVRLVQ